MKIEKRRYHSSVWRKYFDLFNGTRSSDMEVAKELCAKNDLWGRGILLPGCMPDFPWGHSFRDWRRYTQPVQRLQKRRRRDPVSFWDPRVDRRGKWGCIFEWIPVEEEGLHVLKVLWPGEMEFDEARDDWYTLLNQEQGMMILIHGRRSCNRLSLMGSLVPQAAICMVRSGARTRGVYCDLCDSVECRISGRASGGRTVYPCQRAFWTKPWKDGL